MKKCFFSSVAFLLSICMVCSSVFAVEPNTNEATDNGNVFYLGEQEQTAIDIGEVQVIETLDGITCTEATKLITTDEKLNGSLKQELRTALAENSRILVLGNTSEESLREYFGLPSKPVYVQESVEENISENETRNTEYAEDVRVVDVAEFPMLGRMLYQNEAGINVTGVYVEDINNEALVESAIDYCFEYDYFGLSGSRNVAARDFSSSWTNVDINTGTYVQERATITTSIGIEKNDGNPNFNGEYLFYLPYKVDVDIKTPYVIHNVKVNVAGGNLSKVYDYGPKDLSCNANVSVSFQLPQAISVSFTPGTKVAISKVGGGLDSNYFTVKYQPKNFLNVDTYTPDRMQCEAHIEGYQEYNSFQAFGTFEVETYRAQQPTGDNPGFVEGVIIKNSLRDKASGR